MGTEDLEDIDAIYERYKDTDFSNAKRVWEIPKLQQFQERLRAKQGIVAVNLPAEQVNKLSRLCDKDKDFSSLISEAIDEYLAAH